MLIRHLFGSSHDLRRIDMKAMECSQCLDDQPIVSHSQLQREFRHAGACDLRRGDR